MSKNEREMFHQRIAELEALVAQKDQKIAEQDQQLTQMQHQLDRLGELITNAQRARFGQSSEKQKYVLGNQISLFNEVLSARLFEETLVRLFQGILETQRGNLSSDSNNLRSVFQIA